MRKQFKLIIRTDATVPIGTGHLMRCFALAQAWQGNEQDRGGSKVIFLSHCDSEALRQRIIDEGFEFIPIEKPHPDPSDLNQTLKYLEGSARCSLRSAPRSTPHALWLVLDGYHFTSDYQKAIRENGYRLLTTDDMAHLDHYHTDILLNQNIHASSLRYSCDRDTVKLLGCEYVLLRREFLKYKDYKREISDKAKKILVTMGGSDPDNVTLKVIEALNMLNTPDIEVKIAIGPSNPHKELLENAMRHAPCSMLCVENASNMAELMSWADMAVSAGGSTCCELAFMSLPAILIVTADNQKEIAAGLNKKGVAENLGWHSDVSTDQISYRFKYLLSKNSIRKNMSMNGKGLIDGLGVNRIIDRMLAES